MQRLNGGPVVAVYGCFQEVRAPEKLVYTWRWENAFDDMPMTRVTVQFIEDGAATEVVLVHEDLPEIAVCLKHRSGWIAAWDRIERNLVASES